MRLWNNVFIFGVAVILETSGAPADYDVRDGEIYNGGDTSPRRYRWMVWIKQNGAFICGGTLLSKGYVVTAAQCVQRSAIYQVVVGDYDRESIDGSEQTIRVTERYVHPNWNGFTLENDIAILKLASPADVDSKSIAKVPRVSNITMDQEIVDDDSVKCVVTGWGYTISNGKLTLSALLQEMDITISNATRCSELLPGSYQSTTQLCFENSNSNTCYGDTGGPWVCKIDTRWTLVGIHSYGLKNNDCRPGGRAGTRVSYYLDWIETHVPNLNEES